MCPGALSRCAPQLAYLAIIGMLRDGFPDIQWTLEEMIAEGDKVAARFTMRGTRRGPSSVSHPPGNQPKCKLFWGPPRIHGELLKLGIEVSQATVAQYMARRRS
jgi:hypothetical protein